MLCVCGGQLTRGLFWLLVILSLGREQLASSVDPESSLAHEGPGKEALPSAQGSCIIQSPCCVTRDALIPECWGWAGNPRRGEVTRCWPRTNQQECGQREQSRVVGGETRAAWNLLHCAVGHCTHPGEGLQARGGTGYSAPHALSLLRCQLHLQSRETPSLSLMC